MRLPAAGRAAGRLHGRRRGARRQGRGADGQGQRDTRAERLRAPDLGLVGVGDDHGQAQQKRVGDEFRVNDVAAAGDAVAEVGESDHSKAFLVHGCRPRAVRRPAAPSAMAIPAITPFIGMTRHAAHPRSADVRRPLTATGRAMCSGAITAASPIRCRRVSRAGVAERPTHRHRPLAILVAGRTTSTTAATAAPAPRLQQSAAGTLICPPATASSQNQGTSAGLIERSIA